jgi:roadblock/LC7 domain-containing protein
MKMPPMKEAGISPFGEKMTWLPLFEWVFLRGRSLHICAVGCIGVLLTSQTATVLLFSIMFFDTQFQEK